MDGGPALRLCNSFCSGRWDITGKFFYLNFYATGKGDTYMLPVNSPRGIPNLPPGGVTNEAALKGEKGLIVIPHEIDSAMGPNRYSYTRQNTRRNIYRIPLPD
jgi:hypothetical protein